MTTIESRRLMAVVGPRGASGNAHNGPALLRGAPFQLNGMGNPVRRYLDYDAARQGLRALCTDAPETYRMALDYARSCGRWRGDVLRYLSRALCYGFDVDEARDLHAQGVPEERLLDRAEWREKVGA